jgi:beta-glucanase (GH16 family)
MQRHTLPSRRPSSILKLAILIVLPIALAQSASAQTWTLVWADEFDGPALSLPNSAKWGFDIGGGGWGNNELETYTGRIQNASIDGSGNLVIKVMQETFTGPDGITRNYTSARLLTKGKYEQRYGRFEARVKLPFGQGLWPAFWMLGNTIDAAGWPACGEIDIMENVGKEPAVNHGSLHGPGYSGGSPLTGIYTLPNDQSFSDDFHVFAIEWEPNMVRFYVDGNLYSMKTIADLPTSRRWVFDHPFFMILNVAVGGNFPGNPANITTFPQVMTVDYVRVYADAARIPIIATISTRKKDLILTGQHFDSGSVVLMDGKKQKSSFDEGNPTTLIGKKVARKIASGQTVKIKVRSSDNITTAEYSYVKP